MNWSKVSVLGEYKKFLDCLWSMIFVSEKYKKVCRFFKNVQKYSRMSVLREYKINRFVQKVY